MGTVTLSHAGLLGAAAALSALADDVVSARRASDLASPISLPSLATTDAKAEWMREQLLVVDQLAALALLLDTDADGTASFSFTGDSWDAADLLRQTADARYGPGFADATGLGDAALATLLLTLGSVGQDVTDDSRILSPDELRDLIVEHPDLARALQNTRPMGEGHGGDLYALTLPFVTAPGGGAEVLEERRRAARDLFENLPADQAAILAMTYPSLIGNLPGVPFQNRADANVVNVVVALDDERAELARTREQHEENQHDWDFLGLNNDDLEGPIARLEDRIALYESILADDRQIVYFDPAGDGAIAEVHGPIGPQTRDVGVLVPGTGSDLSSFQGNADRSLGFQDYAPPGSLTMVSWLGGDMPDSVAQDAPFANYSIDLGPRLADFSRDLSLEIERSEAPDARVTVAGHSYGGAVVGRSELHGLQADRVLHVASAGMGHDIDGPDDLPPTQAGVDRYSLTAPGDLIELAQGAPQVTGNIGHGADPDTVDGTTRLHSGNRADGSFNTGPGSHSGVFEEQSDAWTNIYQVFVGGVVDTYRSPEYEYPRAGPFGPAVPVQVGWNDDGERLDIE